MSNIFSDVLMYGVRSRYCLCSIKSRKISSLKNELVEMGPKRLLINMSENVLNITRTLIFMLFLPIRIDDHHSHS